MEIMFAKKTAQNTPTELDLQFGQIDRNFSWKFEFSVDLPKL